MTVQAIHWIVHRPAHIFNASKTQISGTIGAPHRLRRKWPAADGAPEELDVRTHDATFGELLKQARQAAGLTQEGLAARAGLSARVISDLERNVSRAPRSGTVQLLLSALPLSTFERELLQEASISPSVGQPAARALPSAAPLVGRVRERALLEQHLEGQTPPLLVVAGEPGIGKTRLLQEAASLAAAASLPVLRGASALVGRERTHDPIAAALRAHVQGRSPVHLRRDLHGCAWLVRLLPELASGLLEPPPALTSEHEQATLLTARAVVRYLSNIGSPAGTLLVLDDLHQADPAAVDLLGRLVQSAGDVRLRILVAQREARTSRAPELGSLLARLAHEQLVGHVRLGPLSRDESATLLAQLLAGRPAASLRWRKRVLDEAGGVPFYLAAWAQELRAEPDGAAEDVPWAIRQSVHDRIDALSPGVRPALEAIVVAGGRAAAPLLIALTARPEQHVLEGLEAACDAGLVEEDGQVYRFAYGAVHRVVETDLSPARRLVLDRRLAALGSAGPFRGVGPGTGNAADLENASELEEREYHLAVLRRHQRLTMAPARRASDR
jgi:transcriptional regulator with XRE-family HTH domain